MIANDISDGIVVIDAVDVRVTVEADEGKALVHVYDKNTNATITKTLAIEPTDPKITDEDLRASIAALDQLAEAAVELAETQKVNTLALVAARSRSETAALNYGRFVVSQRALGRPALTPLALLDIIARAIAGGTP